MQNATAPPSKRTTLERATNSALLRIFFLVMLVSFSPQKKKKKKKYFLKSPYMLLYHFDVFLGKFNRGIRKWNMDINTQKRSLVFGNGAYQLDFCRL
jgi:hypothetical protein